MSDQLFNRQLQRIKTLKSLGEEPYIDQAVKNNCNIQELSNKYQHYSKEELLELESSGLILQLSGRIVLIRNQGGVIFANLRNDNADIQLFIKKNLVQIVSFKLAMILCIGDLIHVTGVLMKTRTGVLSIKCTQIKMLSIAIQPLPTKNSDARMDIETKYRQRYLDLIVNKNAYKVATQRSCIIANIRKFLTSRGFLEVETPMLQSVYGGAIANPFITHHNNLKEDFYLRVSEEIPLKKLLIGGLNKIFEIGRIFRNEGASVNHNPEFTLLEWYESYATLADTKRKCREIIQFVTLELLNTLTITHRNVKIHLDNEYWKTFTMVDIIYHKSGVNFKDVTTLDQAKNIARKHNIFFVDNSFLTIGKIMELFFNKFVEHTLINPTFIVDFPLDISPLAKRCALDPRFCQRFELYINGTEIANAFNELTDYFDQTKRFKEQKEHFEEFSQLKEIDNSFLEALKYGMPPASGIGIGIDRIVMILTNSKSIKDVILFPTLKKIKNDK